jgi:rod shape-determining protein MreD
VRRALINVLAITAALTVQVSVLNRVPLPGGAVPGLVLVTVAALAVADGPVAGMLTGFVAGLALDVAPPASHLAGEYALVFCLVGYACGWLATMLEQALPRVAVVVAGAAAGEAAQALLGVMLSDPDVTWSAARRVLPAAIAYDAMLSPFVLWLVSLIRPAGTGDGTLRVRFPELAPRKFGGVPGVLRPAGAGMPRLRLAGTGLTTGAPRKQPPRKQPRLQLAGTGLLGVVPPPVKKEPRLRLAGAGLQAAPPPQAKKEPRFHPDRSSRTGKRPGPPARTAPVKTPRFHRAPPGPFSRAAGWLRPVRRKAKPGKGWLSAGGSGHAPKAPPAPRQPGKGWLSAKPPGRAYRPRRPSRRWLKSTRRRPRRRRGGLR